MSLFDSHLLNGGPDIFFVGSGTNQSKARKAGVQPYKAFIYTIKPNESGERLQAFSSAEGHVKKERELIDLMFTDKDVEKAKATDADLYAPRTLRKMAMDAGNIYGRSGSMKGNDGKLHDIVWVWNLPQGSQSEILDITTKLGFVPDDTMLLWNQSEEGTVGDFVKGGGAKEEKPEDEELARLHLATGTEKEALQKKFGRTADVFRQYGLRPDISPEKQKEMDKEGKTTPTILKHYWDKARKEGMPYLGKYQENLSFKQFLNIIESID